MGFVFPAFINRTSDVNSIMYYTKNAKDPHPELMEEALGCFAKQTAAIQKETFQTIIKNSINTDEKKAEKTFIEIQENLNTMIDEYKEIYDDKDDDPITLTEKDIQNLLIESGVPEETTTKIEKCYVENFGKDLPLAENLIDSKALKANAQIKKEEQLKKQVEILQTKLEQIEQNSSVNNDDNLSSKVNEPTLEDNYNEDLQNNVTSQYDIVLQVKPEKVPQIKSQIIDGQKCIVIPINNDEQTTING